jgi:hypothetical protein
MADDIDMSADQEENEEQEMSTEELETLFNEEEDEGGGESTSNEDEESEEQEESDDENSDEESDEDSDDDDDSEDEESDDDEDDSADDEEGDEEEEDEDPLADIKAKAAALKNDEQAAADKETANAERAKNMEVAKADALKDLFDSDKITGKDGEEIDMVEFRENYGSELEGVMAAMAFKMMGSTVEKALESSEFASSADIQAIKAENDEFRLMSEIAQDHPDIWKLKNDDKFWGWVDSQGPEVKTLMDKSGAQNIAAVVGAYKKASIQKTNKTLEKTASAKKKKHTDIHSSTVRSKKSKRGGGSKKGGQMSQSEQSAEFDKIELED